MLLIFIVVAIHYKCVRFCDKVLTQGNLQVYGVKDVHEVNLIVHVIGDCSISVGHINHFCIRRRVIWVTIIFYALLYYFIQTIGYEVLLEVFEKT